MDVKCDNTNKLVKRVMSHSKRPIIPNYNYLYYIQLYILYTLWVVGKGATLEFRYRRKEGHFPIQIPIIPDVRQTELLTSVQM